MTSNLTNANSQLNNSILSKNNTAMHLSNITNSSKNKINDNNNTNADLSPDLGYHYEDNFY
ncbi:MAG TPA: hypothetical protein VN704_02180 [Verrucomicrobiae bacterium]|nr:hypothetical protein [Verrucomicrobiae bacterium]